MVERSGVKCFLMVTFLEEDCFCCVYEVGDEENERWCHGFMVAVCVEKHEI